MMISEKYNGKVFIADFTDYVNDPSKEPVEYKGIVVGTEENGIIPSFVLHNDNECSIDVINNERNNALFKREDGSKVTQCECIIFADRNDNRKAWMMFLELKYCKEKNRYDNMLGGISQLKDTCKYVFKEKKFFEEVTYKKYLVISTPNVEPLDPFDASYFDQDFMLSVKEETGAVIKAVNEAFIRTPAVIGFVPHR